jgi:hypothetical protein
VFCWIRNRHFAGRITEETEPRSATVRGKFERRKKMAATVTGSKTCTQGLAPHLSAARLTSILATPIENLTVAQFKDLRDALHRIAGGEENTNTIGALLK